jgi:hypothetical protein
LQLSGAYLPKTNKLKKRKTEGGAGPDQTGWKRGGRSMARNAGRLTDRVPPAAISRALSAGGWALENGQLPQASLEAPSGASPSHGPAHPARPADRTPRLIPLQIVNF